MLGHVLQQKVNIVNAPFLAKERGIEIMESKNNIAHDYADTILLETKANGTSYSIEGTLFGNKIEARVVRLNDYHVDAIPAGYLLVLTNVDKPGIIASVSTILGENAINIAGMTVGRNLPGGKAVTVINVDSAIKEEIMKKLSKIQNVIDVKMVVF